MGGVRSRDSILDATRAVIGEVGFDGVNIAVVAKRAGVSRQTVYSIFGTREELIGEAVTERLTALLGAYESVLDSADSLLEVLVEIVIESRRRILGDPLMRALTLSGEGNPIHHPGAVDRSLEYTAHLLRPAVERFPEFADRIDFLADVGVHIGWSVMVLDDPDSRSDADLREFLTAWLAPLLQPTS
ncbi:AcrR family transcriptional regulator [Dietzia sp. 2505]